MKIPNAARFNMLIILAALPFTLLELRIGIRISGVHFIRQGWILEHPFFWQWGWWLWLAVIFGWMWLLITLMWSYLPAHRVTTMLQSGLMLIAAVLAISGIIVWMAALPQIMTQENAAALIPLVDALALGLIGGGALMGGAVTAWIGLELYQQQVLSRLWVPLLIMSGLAALPSPFLLPNVYGLLLAALCWWLWAIYLAFLPCLPSPFPAWK
ncbi:MAG: hypothetical protein R3C14_36735 [Caldilineaceae bacterium]